MRLFLSTTLTLIVAAVFAWIGWYYITNAKTLCNMFYEKSRRFKPPLSYIFPSRLYKSKPFVVAMQLGGYVALACSGLLLWTIILTWMDR